MACSLNCSVTDTNKVANGLVDDALKFDARSDQVYAGGSVAPAVQSVTYDADGRTTQRIGGCQICQTMQAPPVGVSRTYDAENHLLNEEYLSTSSTGGYVASGTDTSLQWGLDGHPSAMTTYVNPNTVTPPTQPQIPQYTNESLHWDRRSLLYSVGDTAGYPADAQITLYIGKLGVVDLQRFTGGAVSAFKITTIDRDGSGQEIQEHASDYFSAFDPTTSAWIKPIGKFGITFCPAYTGSGGCVVGKAYLSTEPQFVEPDFTLPPIPMTRADGYQMGDVTIQGVRAYDPSTAQWVSPDGFSGVTTDPGSQKPFMWNGNNPVAYGDPSGFSPDCTDPAPGQPPNGCMGGVNWTAQYSFLKSVWSDVLWLLPGGPEDSLAAKAGEEFFQHFGTQVADTFRGELSHLISGGHLVQSGQTTVIEVHGGEAALRGAFQSLAKASGKSTEFSANGVEFFETDGWSASLRPFSSNKSGNLPTLQISRVTRSGGSVLKIRALRIPR